MTEDNNFPFFFGLRVVQIKRGISKYRHLYFIHERHDELEKPERNARFGRVNKDNIVKWFAVSLRRDPLAVRSIRHGGIKDPYFHIIDFVATISCIVWSLADNLDVIKLQIDHQKP